MQSHTQNVGVFNEIFVTYFLNLRRQRFFKAIFHPLNVHTAIYYYKAR